MVLILHIHEIIYISLKLIIPRKSRRKAPGREVYNPVTREALVFPTSIATPAWFSLCYKSVEFGLYPPRLAYKSSSIFFHECEAGAVYVDFLCFLWQKRARERELDLFPLQKIALSDSFWCELFVSLSPVSTRECVVANWQSMSKQIRTMNRRRDNFLDFDQFTVRFKRGDYRKYVFSRSSLYIWHANSSFCRV